MNRKKGSICLLAFSLCCSRWDGKFRRRAEYGFGEHGFEHRAQRVFFALAELRGENSEFLSAYYLCDNSNSPSFFAELTKFAPKLSEAQ